MLLSVPIRLMPASSQQSSVKKRQISLYVVLVAPFLAQIILTVWITGWLSLRNGEQSVQNLADQLMERTGQQVSQHLEDFVALPHRLNHENVKLLKQEEIGENPDLLRQMFWAQANSYPEVGYISYTQANGEFLGVGSWLEGYDLVVDEISAIAPGQVSTYTIKEDGSKGELLVKEAYEPREQDWYINTQTVNREAWTFTIEELANREPYIGVSLNMPVYESDNPGEPKLKGMVGADFLIEDISRYLESIQFSPSGQIFVVDREGMLIGNSIGESIIRKDSDGNPERVNIQATRGDLAKHIQPFLSDLSPTVLKEVQTLNFELDQKKHFLLLQPWQDEQGLDWVIILAVPASDFMGQIQINTRNTIGLCLVALLISSLFGLKIARRIAAPIRQLRHNSQTISQGDLNFPQSQPKQSFILEITELNQAFEHMAYWLKESFHQLNHRAHHDGLTGLLNREAFRENLLQELQQRTQRTGDLIGTSHQALLFLDLDYFKLINDSLGHMVGDRLLLEVSHRLQQHVRDRDMLARFGGDEFVILLHSVAQQQDAEQISKRLIQGLQKPFVIEDNEVYIDVSIGIVMIPPNADSADDLLRSADLALYRAKSNGRGRYELFDDHMHIDVLSRLHLETDLRNALERQEFSLHYQPIVCTVSQEIKGFEALVRWQHTEKGWISPGKFIPVAEETDLIIRLGWWVLEEACQQMAIWQQNGDALANAKMSVNVSTKQFFKPDFVEGVQAILERVPLEAKYLKIEITESLLMHHEGAIQNKFKQLQALGIELSLDDFGTGYSSLSYLHKFKIDTLKIDQSFIQKMHQGDQHKAIIRTIIELAKQMEMNVVAEGVEEEVQLKALEQLGCEMIQGYFIAKPMDAQGINQFMTQRTTSLVIAS